MGDVKRNVYIQRNDKQLTDSEFLSGSPTTNIFGTTLFKTKNSKLEHRRLGSCSSSSSSSASDASEMNTFPDFQKK